MAVVTIQPPLSRRGHGPGLLILVEQGINLSKHDTVLDPPPIQKWAEEGYAVAQIVVAPGSNDLANHVASAIESLRGLESCDNKDQFGIIGELVAVAVLRRTIDLQCLITFYSSPRIPLAASPSCLGEAS